ncbi:MAG: MazG family protein [Kiritimatiellae bacterium]|nr:MazG family protein [Kiritimatiellia bacterium]
MTGIERLHEITARLRDPQTGCPWDRVQTLETLKPCVLEETYELLAAMDDPSDRDNHIEELGDVLLQVMFQAVMAEQEGAFTFDDVANAVADKLVRRHPHVFGDVDAKDPAAVLRNWERIKQTEHRKDPERSALDGIPATLPSLLKARRTLEKAKRIGYEEKLPEVEIKGDPGEFLLAAVKAIAEAGVDSEAALEKAVKAYAGRFRAFEASKRER